MRQPCVTTWSQATYHSRHGIAPTDQVVCATDVCATDCMLTTKRRKRGTTTSAALVRQFTSDHPAARVCGDVNLVASNVMSPVDGYDNKQQLLAKALARRGRSRDEYDYRRKSV